MDRSIGDMPTMPGGSGRSWKGILQPGSSFGRYKVHRFLGRGGMGEVYEVEHQLDGAHYAMKVLSSEIRQTPENIRRFEREAQVMARLRHPNVISVDYFDETDGKYWFRMELAQGIDEGVVTLGDLAAKNGGRIGQGLLVGLFERILDGLSCAHKAGVIHRDLKPGNILLALSDGTTGGIVPKISDFGLVRLVGQDWLLKKTLLSAQQSQKEGATEGTQDSQGLSTQSLVGTYAYMSPEQKQRREIDERSDIYAVGLMIYRLLTGYTNPGEKIRNKDSTLHAFWQRIIDQSVREDPEDRFSNVDAMLEEIRRGHRVLASLDGKASLKKCSAELQAKRYYTANRYLDEAVMIFPDDPEVLEFKTFMREQLNILRELKSKMQDFRRQKKYDEALTVSEQFRVICIEDEDINEFVGECPQLITREQSRQLIEEALQFLEAGENERASQVVQKALSLDPENNEAKRINDQALAMIKKAHLQHTREQINKALQKTYSLLKQKHYAQALDALNDSPCSDSHHPKIVALRNACQAGLKKVEQYWERAEKAKASSDTQGAIALLNEVLDSVAPEDPGTIERLDQFRSEVKELSTAGIDMDHAWKNKSYKACLEAAERILAIQPEHEKAQQCKLACLEKISVIQSHADEAEEYYRNQQYDEAVAAFEQMKKYYYLGKGRAKGEAEIETQHSVYSPEYRKISDRIAAARQAKTSMEQALQRAKERLEAGDLVETRLALDEYFELQTDGPEGLILRQRMESLHRRATMLRWLRRSVACLAVVTLIGLGLAYGTTSFLMIHKMQKELERSCSELTFENLKDTQKQAGRTYAALQQSRLMPLSSIKSRWNNWKENLQRGESAWEDYACGAYEEGRGKIESIPSTEFRSWIQRAFDTFVQEANILCTDAENYLVGGLYDDCITDCNAFLLDYPQHSRVLDLLQKAKSAQKLEKCVVDPNVDLTRLSAFIRDLNDISPRHHKKQDLEAHCIERVKSKYDFWDQPLPKEYNPIIKQLNLCKRAKEELTWFVQCYGYQPLYTRLTGRIDQLLELMDELDNFEFKRDKAKRSVEQEYWGEAKQILDTLSTDQDEVAQLKRIIDGKISQLKGIIKDANEQVAQGDWFDAETTIHKVWITWKRKDTCDSLDEAKELETRIHAVVQKERERIRVFLETFDQNNHDQIERFIQGCIENNPDLVEIYDRWLDKLDRDVQNAVEQGKINAALNLLSRISVNERIQRRANDEKLKGSLQSLKDNERRAHKRREKAQGLADRAQALKNENCVEALWLVHEALKINLQCDSAQQLEKDLQRQERDSTHYWREAKSLYDDQFYFSAWRDADRAQKRFPGDLRAVALLRDLETMKKAARRDAQNVLKGKIAVKDFYDDYIDYNEFGSDVNKRLKKAILENLKNRLVNLSEERRRIIIAAREAVLQDEPEYHDVVKTYGSGRTPEQLHNQDIADADWSRIKFDLSSGALDVILEIKIEGHGSKVSNTIFLRCQDEVYLRVSKPSDPLYSRETRLTLNPWTAYRIKINRSCLDVKNADVQIVKKGWPIEKYDMDAMVDQIIKQYPAVDKSLARKSLERKLDQIEDKGNITTLQLHLIGWWQEEQFFEIEIDDSGDDSG